MEAQKFEKDIIKSKKIGGEDIQITFIKHASLMIEYSNQFIYIDPIGEFCNFETMPKADFILVTHDHYDHFDSKAIQTIRKPSTKIVANKLVVDALNEGIALANNEDVSLSQDIHVLAVAAYNTTEGRDKFHPKIINNGYVLTIDETRIYISGDTEHIDEMKNLKDKIDIAFLSVNQPYTMTIEQATQAAKDIKPKILYPYHYGQTEQITPIHQLIQALKEEPVEIRIRNME
ncbi:MAG: MBL fold metallo-hydrolase [Bacteroidales bacterium]|nr:MBL fold metallo-hydrolase [Bacteroidales bacterium]MDD4738614.1 MBL fold metallo-hydrolase [Bacteroidales bacterium]NCC18704.1 MBL fold metallo-hydrolase [Bacteroidia bacterium]